MLQPDGSVTFYIEAGVVTPEQAQQAVKEPGSTMELVRIADEQDIAGYGVGHYAGHHHRAGTCQRCETSSRTTTK